MDRRREALIAVKQASARAASVVHIEMKRGLVSLASIAATAPLVGFVGTTRDIIGAFRGLGTEKSSNYWFPMAREISQALAPTALGLVIAVSAIACYRYLSGRLENFDIEMKNASLELLDELARL